MKKVISVLLAFMMFAILPFQTFAESVARTGRVNLFSGTNVIVKTRDSFTSNQIGEMVGYVVDDVYSDDGSTVLIEAGTNVYLHASVEKNGALGKAGKIVINNATTTAVDGKTIALSANLSANGDGRSGLAWGLGIGTGIFTLFGLLFLLLKGGKAEIPAGTLIPYVAVEKNYVINVGQSAE